MHTSGPASGTASGRDVLLLERRSDAVVALKLDQSPLAWFNVAGILNPSPLVPDIDLSAQIGYSAAQTCLG